MLKRDIRRMEVRIDSRSTRCQAYCGFLEHCKPAGSYSVGVVPGFAFVTPDCVLAPFMYIIYPYEGYRSNYERTDQIKNTLVHFE